MRRVLILLAAVGVAGAFTAGAVLFGRDPEPENVAAVEVRCAPGEDCQGKRAAARRQVCRGEERPDAIRLTVVQVLPAGPPATSRGDRSPYGADGPYTNRGRPERVLGRVTTRVDC
jgi:hypothetical protein